MPNTNPVTVPIKGKDELTPALKTAQGGLSGFVNHIKSFTAGFQDITAGIGFVKDAIRLTGEAYNATVGEALKYSDTVRQMSRVSGQSAEETSRLIQLTDDLGVETSDLEAAMSAAARNGIAFNIESIAKLADQYQRISDPVSRNTLLIDNFGKSGLNMAAAMAQGGDAIRRMSSEVDKSLILNQKQLDQSRQLEIQIDNLNDAWMGVKVQVGTDVIPVLTDYITATQSINGETGGLLGVLQRFGPVQAITIANAFLQAKATRESAEAMKTEADAAEKATAALTHRFTALDRNPNSKGWSDPNWKGVTTSSNWGQPATMTVKNEATLNVKVTATGLDAGSNWTGVIQKTIRDMQAAGVLPRAK